MDPSASSFSKPSAAKEKALLKRVTQREIGGLNEALHGLRSANGPAGGRNSLEAHQFYLWLVTGEILLHLANGDLLNRLRLVTLAINAAFPQRPIETKGAPGQFDLDRRFRANSFGLHTEAVLFASSAAPGVMPSPAAITHCTHQHPPVTLEAETSPALLDVMGVWVTLVKSGVDRVRELLGLSSVVD